MAHTLMRDTMQICKKHHEIDCEECAWAHSIRCQQIDDETAERAACQGLPKDSSVRILTSEMEA